MLSHIIILVQMFIPLFLYVEHVFFQSNQKRINHQKTRNIICIKLISMSCLNFMLFSSQIIQTSKKLNLTVHSVGRVPISFVAEATCKWVDMRGRRASPPPGVDSNGRMLTADGIHKSDLRLLGDDDERKVCDNKLVI